MLKIFILLIDFMIHIIQDKVAAVFHEPFGCTCRPTDANRSDPLEPVHGDFLRAFDLMALWINPFALIEKHFSVAAFPTRHEQDQIMFSGERSDMRYSVGHLPANGVKTFKFRLSRHMFLNIVNDSMELIQRLGGL